MSLRDDLVSDEGIRLAVYKCPAGFNTVGVGHNLDANPLTAQEILGLGCTTGELLEGKHITKENALWLLDRDIDRCRAQVDKELPWMVSRPQRVQDAVLNMVFQLGLGGTLNFKKMLACLQAGDYEGAKKHALDSDWAKQTPNRAKRVTDMFGSA